MENKQEDYSIALQRAIEYHCKNKLVPKKVAIRCPHHAKILNCHLSNQSSGQEETDESNTSI